MDQKIITIPLKVPCYLIQTGDSFLLVDTGDASDRAALVKALDRAAVTPVNLKLVILTHGDFDHSGNAAFLRQSYGVKIAMHADDAGMVERGDMGWKRKARPDKMTLFMKFTGFISPLFSTGKFATFSPDVAVDEGFDLTSYGCAARVLHLPGHSKGSIGVLAAGGGLFCGDLIYNFFGMPRCEFIDDLADFQASLDKLKQLNSQTVYPGHGRPFPLEKFIHAAR